MEDKIIVISSPEELLELLREKSGDGIIVSVALEVDTDE